MKLKKISLALVVSTLVLLNTATPASAFTNPLTKFTSSLKQKANRFYLQYLPGDKPGDMVLQQSAVAMEEVKSMQIKAEISGKVDSAEGEELGSGKLRFSGPVQIDQPSDPLSAKQDFAMDGEVSMGGTTLKASADFKQDGKDMYVKVNMLPVLPFFDASKLKGQWLKMPVTETERTKTADELTEEEKAQLTKAGEQLIKDSQVGKAKKEKKNGQDVYVVEVTVPDEAIIKYMETVVSITSLKEDADAELPTKKSLEEGLKATDDFKLVVWVDQKTFYTTHAELPLTIDLTKIQPDPADEVATEMESITPFGTSAKPGKMSGALVMDLSDFNQPVSFEVPADARNFQEALMETMTIPGLTGDAPELDPSVFAKPTKIKPVELQDLSKSEKQMLKEYGVEIEDIIP